MRAMQTPSAEFQSPWDRLVAATRRRAALTRRAHRPLWPLTIGVCAAALLFDLAYAIGEIVWGFAASVGRPSTAALFEKGGQTLYEFLMLLEEDELGSGRRFRFRIDEGLIDLNEPLKALLAVVVLGLLGAWLLSRTPRSA
jgi:hypothetical protein